MHLAANLSDLCLDLWRGTIDCGLTDDVATWDWAVLRDAETWSAHGESVERAGPYLPPSFDRKPRNVAEKINTGYKTWEFQLYMFGLGPALLYNVLPRQYWANYCKLVRGFQLMCQHVITTQDLQQANVLLCAWEREFELIYYQLREDRLHFVRPCVHQTNHLVAETIQKGPPVCYAQWTMERTIGNLGQEIRQPSRPYANLSREGVRRCKVNTLLSIMPDLDEPPKGLPEGSIDLGDGFALLRKRDRYMFSPDGAAAQAMRNFIGDGRELPRIKRWARLLLPNKQIARSAWREMTKPLDQTRMSRNVKLQYDGQIRFGEVLYFTRLSVEADIDDDRNWRFADVAIICLYSLPDEDLLQISSQTVVSCSRLADICVVDVKQILSVVAMIPHTPRLPSGVTEARFFMMEKPGLDISPLSGYAANINPLEDNDNAPDVE
ncbi:hypothetical protein EDD22DRAFT_771576 [Suillus occidentalis]|nr:hypothetical protein EDD22DRAFT_771576 [Suillus occidentalis]